MAKRLVCGGILVGLLTSAAWAATLSAEQVQRIENARGTLFEVSSESVEETISWISAEQYPEIKIQMEEAVAKTYAKIKAEHTIEKSKDKKWLYGVIKLNLAYLQFTDGGEHIAGNDDPVNLLVQKTLKEYLSPEVLSHPGFAKSVE